MISNKKSYLILFWVILLIHTLGVFFIFPVYSVLNNEQFYQGDYPNHFYHTVKVSENLGKGNLLGYDTNFYAGNVEGGILTSNNVLGQIFTHIFSFIGTERAFKIFVVLTFILFPILIYFSALNFKFTKNEALIAMIFSTGVWHLDGWIQMMPRIGMFSFMFASALGIYSLSLFVKYLREKKKKDLVLLFIFVPLMTLTHFLITITMIIPFISAYLISLKKTTKKQNINIAILCIFTIIINLFWIISVMLSWQYKISSATQMGSELFIIFRTFRFNGTFFMRSLLWMLTIAGIYVIAKQKKLKNISAILATLTWGVILVSLGNQIGFGEMQPLRNWIIILISLCIIGSSLISYIFPKRKKIVLIVLIVIFGSLSLIVSANSEQTPTKLDQPTQQLVEWIKDNTNNDARILIQEPQCNPFIRTYAFMHLLTNRSFLSGPAPDTWTKQSYASFRNETLFGKDIEEYESEELESELNKFNVGWSIICSEKGIKKFLENYKLTKRIGGYYVFSNKANHSYILEGKGNVKLIGDEIFVENAIENITILKFHYFDGLKTEPELEIKKYEFEDPAGFIQINNRNISQFKIYN